VNAERKAHREKYAMTEGKTDNLGEERSLSISLGGAPFLCLDRRPEARRKEITRENHLRGENLGPRELNKTVGMLSRHNSDHLREEGLCGNRGKKN